MLCRLEHEWRKDRTHRLRRTPHFPEARRGYSGCGHASILRTVFLLRPVFRDTPLRESGEPIFAGGLVGRVALDRVIGDAADRDDLVDHHADRWVIGVGMLLTAAARRTSTRLADLKLFWGFY